MPPSTKLIGFLSCVFLLTVLSVAYAAHNSGESQPSDERGAKTMKRGDSTPKKGEEEKVDQAKVKEDTKQAREEFEKRTAKSQAETQEKRKGESQ